MLKVEDIKIGDIIVIPELYRSSNFVSFVVQKAEQDELRYGGKVPVSFLHCSGEYAGHTGCVEYAWYFCAETIAKGQII